MTAFEKYVEAEEEYYKILIAYLRDEVSIKDMMHAHNERADAYRAWFEDRTPGE